MRIFAMAILGVFLAARGASGAVLWDESVSSDLSNDWATPTTGGTITNGTYFITGTIGPSDLVDAVSFVVPQGRPSPHSSFARFRPDRASVPRHSRCGEDLGISARSSSLVISPRSHRQASTYCSSARYPGRKDPGSMLYPLGIPPSHFRRRVPIRWSSP